MSETEEVAKAVQSVADFGTESVKASQKVGGFFAKVFKEPAHEVSGLITDKLRFVRWKRLLQMSDDVNKILEEKGVHETRGVPPKIALPIFEDSSLEDNDDIRSLWNNLLANAMNPEFNDEIRYGFVEIIKNITGREALILKLFYDSLSAQGKLTKLEEVTNYSIDKEQFCAKLGLSLVDYSISAYNLIRTQCIAPAVIKGGMKFGDHTATAYKGIDAVTITPLGIKFVEACMK